MSCGGSYPQLPSQPSLEVVGQALTGEAPVLLAAVGSHVASSAPVLCPDNVTRT